ncbi:MAG: Fe-S cluster assembly protein SufD [Ignavibacteriales bacterium]|nr:Fe-S cluster assembly protein SufD [Ignavibacteriales bacterium]
MSEVKNHYVSEFQTFEKNGANKAPAWVHDVRKNALSVFNELGFPTTKQEDWKYTNVTPIAKGSFKYSSAPVQIGPDVVKSFLVEGTDQFVMTFVNGHLAPEHSQLSGIPNGIVVSNLIGAYSGHGNIIREYLSKYVKHQKNPFTALNTAFINDGAFVHVPANVAVEKPIHLLFISTKKESDQIASHIRNLIVVEEGAKVNFVVSYRSVGDHTNLTNVVTEIVAKKNSLVEVVKVQKENESAFHVENLHAHQHETSDVRIFSLAIGGAIARNDMSVIIDGEAAECNLNGLYIVTGEQLIDHHTFMHHIHPNCPSHELFKGILTDHGRAVFNGKVYVEPEAQKTDSKQTNRNLLLSDTAIVDTKPELEIFADDVKCTHGAAVGGMNESHSFYLKTRGITEESAKGILTVGFAAEATAKIVHPALRHHVDLMVVDHLRSKLGTANLPDIVHA